MQSIVPADGSTDSADRLNQPPLQHINDPMKEAERLQIENLELTLCNKRQEVDSLEHRKQDLRHIIELSEELRMKIEDTNKTLRDVKLERDAHEEEKTQLKEKLAEVETDLKNSKDELNEYKTKLDRAEKQCEHYHCETEKLRRELTKVTEERRYLEHNTAMAKKQNSTGSLELGKHFVYSVKFN